MTIITDNKGNKWDLDNLDPYHHWQLEKYGNILVDRYTLPCGHTEASQEALDKEAEWMNDQWERQMWEHEGNGLNDY